MENQKRPYSALGLLTVVFLLLCVVVYLLLKIYDWLLAVVGGLKKLKEDIHKEEPGEESLPEFSQEPPGSGVIRPEPIRPDHRAFPLSAPIPSAYRLNDDVRVTVPPPAINADQSRARGHPDRVYREQAPAQSGRLSAQDMSSQDYFDALFERTSDIPLYFYGRDRIPRSLRVVDPIQDEFMRVEPRVKIIPHTDFVTIGPANPITLDPGQQEMIRDPERAFRLFPQTFPGDRPHSAPSPHRLGEAHATPACPRPRGSSTSRMREGPFQPIQALPPPPPPPRDGSLIPPNIPPPPFPAFAQPPRPAVPANDPDAGGSGQRKTPSPGAGGPISFPRPPLFNRDGTLILSQPPAGGRPPSAPPLPRKGDVLPSIATPSRNRPPSAPSVLPQGAMRSHPRPAQDGQQGQGTGGAGQQDAAGGSGQRKTPSPGAGGQGGAGQQDATGVTTSTKRESPDPDADGGGLLADIRKGIQLKKTEIAEKKPEEKPEEKPASGNIVMDALLSAFKKKEPHLNPKSDESESDHEEWEEEDLGKKTDKTFITAEAKHARTQTVKSTPSTTTPAASGPGTSATRSSPPPLGAPVSERASIFGEQKSSAKSSRISKWGSKTGPPPKGQKPKGPSSAGGKNIAGAWIPDQSDLGLQDDLGSVLILDTFSGRIIK